MFDKGINCGLLIDGVGGSMLNSQFGGPNISILLQLVANIAYCLRYIVFVSLHLFIFFKILESLG